MMILEFVANTLPAGVRQCREREELGLSNQTVHYG